MICGFSYSISILEFSFVNHGFKTEKGDLSVGVGMLQS